MDTLFVNSKNSGTSNLYRLLLNLADKIILKRSEKYVALWNISIYSTGKNNKFKTSPPTWNKKFELTDGSYDAQYSILFWTYL